MVKNHKNLSQCYRKVGQQILTVDIANCGRVKHIWFHKQCTIYCRIQKTNKKLKGQKHINTYIQAIVNVNFKEFNKRINNFESRNGILQNIRIY